MAGEKIELRTVQCEGGGMPSRSGVKMNGGVCQVCGAVVTFKDDGTAWPHERNDVQEMLRVGRLSKHPPSKQRMPHMTIQDWSVVQRSRTFTETADPSSTLAALLTAFDHMHEEFKALNATPGRDEFLTVTENGDVLCVRHLNRWLAVGSHVEFRKADQEESLRGCADCTDEETPK